ncbi:MAG TPA: ATP-grasp fold amidoligase family protein [Emticicia sp.]
MNKNNFLWFLYNHRRFPKSHNGTIVDMLYKARKSRTLIKKERVQITSKYHVKTYVEKMGLGRLNVATIGYFTDYKDMPYMFEKNVIIKPSHLSGKVWYKNANEVLTEKEKSEIKKAIKSNYYLKSGELNYLFCEKGIIVEPVLFEDKDIEDFKVFCYKGVPKIIQVDIDRHSIHTRKFFTREWIEIDIEFGYPKSKKTIKCPQMLDEILDAAKVLSSKFEFIRIDFYTKGTEVYVGEITNVHGNNCERFKCLDDELKFTKILIGD